MDTFIINFITISLQNGDKNVQNRTCGSSCPLFLPKSVSWSDIVWNTGIHNRSCQTGEESRSHSERKNGRLWLNKRIIHPLLFVQPRLYTQKSSQISKKSGLCFLLVLCFFGVREALVD